MTRRGFLGLVGSVPFFGFLKGGESAEAKSSPPREVVGSSGFASHATFPDWDSVVTEISEDGKVWIRPMESFAGGGCTVNATAKFVRFRLAPKGGAS